LSNSEKSTVFDCYSEESALAIEMRRLYGKLRQRTRGSNMKCFMLTSATLGEGKSTVSSFLALTIARHKRTKTIIVDADLRRPEGAQVFRRAARARRRRGADR
jgi:Mrp family chromosome partitioning ATPase